MTPAGTRTGFADDRADFRTGDCADDRTAARAAAWGAGFAVVAVVAVVAAAGVPFAEQAVRSAVSTTAKAVDAAVGAAVLDRVTRP